MNPIVFALRHPITVIVTILALIGGSVLAVQRMRIDVFPDLNLPVIFVAQPYGGMDPAQMEGQITNYYEYHFLYIAGIHHVESRSIQGVALMKLMFHPGTDMAQAMAETINYVNRSRAFMPTGTVAPFVMRFDTGSVPVGYVVLNSKNPDRSVGELQRMALFDVRPIFATLPGVSAPPPFGGNQRTIVLRVDPKKLDAQQASLRDVVAALSNGNVVSPSGNVYIADQMPLVRVNAVVGDPQELGNIPLRPGASVCLRDIGAIKDATDIPTGYALVNGKRTVYMLVTKRAGDSTLAVVNAVKANLDRMSKALPEDVELRFEFDQSPYVTRALWGVGTEGLLGAALTGLMVLLFLRDWRSVIVVVLNIPLALLGAVVGLWLTGQALNLMTLGGLALAVGILVDEATVEVENIHTQMGRAPSLARAVLWGNAETAVPRLLAMLCIVAVFLPSFLMQGAARALFVPLSLAVGFAMVTSYLLSSTFVPVLSVWLLRHETTGAAERGRSFRVVQERYGAWLSALAPLRWLVLAIYLTMAGALAAWWYTGHAGVGTEIFPTVDAGQFQLRLRAPTGTNFRYTEKLTLKALDVIRTLAGPGNVVSSVGYVGTTPPNYPINQVYLWMSGPEAAVMRVALRRESGMRVDAFKEQLRTELPRQLGAWLHELLLSEGVPSEQAAERARQVQVSFEPADIVNEVMSLGSSTPIEIAVSGPKLAENQAFAEKIMGRLHDIPSLRDLQFVQPLDYPTVDVRIDREKLGRSGSDVKAVTDSVVAATSSSRYLVPLYWPDPKTGIGFQVQVEVPIGVVKSRHDLGLFIVEPNPGGRPLRLRDIATLSDSKAPGEYDRHDMRRLISITANVYGEDLGNVAARVNRVLRAVGEPPRGVLVDVRGQVVPMAQMFEGLALGLGLAGAAIFLLLTAYFQSIRLALIVMSTAPAVLTGVALALASTGTRLNLQSFMGAIMALGVAVANAILLVTFADHARRAGRPAFEAGVAGARQRLRPILMTTCAMVAGMVPLALSLGDGGEQTAPLGRAVIGGLLASTLTTLTVLPILFALLLGRAGVSSASLDPDDPECSRFDSSAATAGPVDSVSADLNRGGVS